ncbi:MAG: TonB family protein [Terracidiphilus sp.]
MFEDSTFESTGKIRTRSRRWMLVTFALNASILLALILIPLIYPEALPRMASLMLMEAPAPQPEAPKPVHIPPGAVMVRPTFDSYTFSAPRTIPNSIEMVTRPEIVDRPGNWDEMANNGNSTSPDNPFNNDHRVQVVVTKPKGPTAVSSVLMEGLLLRKVIPVYSAIARATRTEGTVILQATISKTGTIENLHVVSGSSLLTQSAMDAVAQWRYRPYLLNGQPVEVETTVNVVFKLD